MSRTKSIEKIGALYRKIEQVRERELHCASSEVAAVTALQAREIEAHQQEFASGRAALALGNVEQWMLAEAGLKLIRLRMPRHRERKAQLEEQRLVAAEVHAESRIRSEQMHRLASAQRRELETLTTRRTQAASDDRFLSRQIWQRGSKAP